MALKSTVFRAELQVADIDRGRYATHALTLARHPSETDERMMVRVLAFALYSDDALTFGPGLSADDEPDLAVRDLTGAIDLWIDVGLPDERDVRRACGRARRVVVVAYGRAADIWWRQNRDRLERLDNLSVLALPPASTQALAALAARGMKLQCTIQERQVWIGGGDAGVHVEPAAWLGRD